LKRLKDEILDLEDFDDTVSLTDFSLDEFRLDLLRYLDANRSELEESAAGVYAVVPPKREVPVAQPGVLFCLRHRIGTGANSPSGHPRDSSQLNPLAPYYLVYVLDDGTVRFTFAQPKQTMLLLRDLAAEEPRAFERLCSLFDARTSDGADMSHYGAAEEGPRVDRKHLSKACRRRPPFQPQRRAAARRPDARRGRRRF
jgi:hypothetical protein